MPRHSVGLLLINLGTPAGPNPEQVGPYLREFLMDPLVIDVPYLLRWFLVNVAIVPRRSKASSLLYKKVWTEKGSPLLQHGTELTEKMTDAIGDRYSVKLAMRYGYPSIALAMAQFREEGIGEILVAPLYPQYSLAATESSIREVKRRAKGEKLHFLPPFYDHPAYLDSVAEVSREPLSQFPYDRVLFSFHGLPEGHVKKTDPSGSHCLEAASCCERISEVNRLCYRAQCFATARGLAERLDIPRSKYDVTFQSRLSGRWVKPFTDDFYRKHPGEGVKRVAVLSPSFVADCLETLEEIAIRGNEEFQAHGGEELRLIPSLNSNTIWVKGLSTILQSFHQTVNHRATRSKHQDEQPTHDQGNSL